MSRPYQSFESEDLHRAWSLLHEYQDFHRLAQHRQKLEEKFRGKQIQWKSMVRAVLSLSMSIDENNMKDEESDKMLSQNNVEMFLQDEIQIDFSESWFEINELKEYFEKATQKLPKTRSERVELLRQILGYPIDYVDHEGTDRVFRVEIDEEPLDLSRIFPLEEQEEMRTGDIVEFTGNRLHGAFYIYRLPRKGLWKQIQKMWIEKQKFDPTTLSDGEEILLVPAMDEYGRGVPFLFATRFIEELPEGTDHKYVDINCPQIAAQIDHPTIRLVHQALEERRQNPRYFNELEGELFVELERFPQEYIAQVMIDNGYEDKVIWIPVGHKETQEMFYSRRILEAEEFIHQQN